jgi:hypothetical protein
MTDVTTVLAGEQAAVYAYGLAAARLSGAELGAALDAMAAHRAQRDRLVARAAASGTSPGPAPAAYDPPFPVVDAASARRLAALVEDRLAGQWAGLAASSAGQQRHGDAVVAQSCAVRSAEWSGAAPVWNGAA